MQATRPGGNILLGGIGPAEAHIPLMTAVMKEINIKPMFRFNHV
jgi:threonine dehydrogenase-like Zn-dependent dehydrogenase